MRLIAFALLLSSLGACVTPGSSRPSEHAVADGMWRDPPDCVVILPSGVDGEVEALTAERAFARHLFGRVSKVIAPDQRDAETRYLALDLRHEGDRARYANLTGCRHGAALTLAGGRRWAVVWAEATLDLEARMIDLTTGLTVWRARHRATRSNGGLPISPLGFLVAVGTAGTFAADGDLVPSVLDDGLRALTATLPDFRGYRVSRNSSVTPLSSRK